MNDCATLGLNLNGLQAYDSDAQCLTDQFNGEIWMRSA